MDLALFISSRRVDRAQKNMLCAEVGDEVVVLDLTLQMLMHLFYTETAIIMVSRLFKQSNEIFSIQMDPTVVVNVHVKYNSTVRDTYKLPKACHHARELLQT